MPSNLNTGCCLCAPQAYNEHQAAETLRQGLQCPGIITSQHFFGFQGFTVLSSRHGGQTLQELNLSMADDLRRQQTPWIGANLFASMATVHKKVGPSCAQLLLSRILVLLHSCNRVADAKQTSGCDVCIAALC